MAMRFFAVLLLAALLAGCASATRTRQGPPRPTGSSRGFPTQIITVP